ncbi:MAG: GNAT family N-acetyltransferase [Agathobacter sp.]
MTGKDIIIEKKEVICSERLMIRPYRTTDRDRLVEILTNTEIAKTFMIPEYETKAEYYELADKLIAYSQIENKTHLEYGVYLGDILIGTVNDCGFDDETIEIGYLIHPDYQGKGYATEVLKVMISEVREMGFKKIIAGFFEDNIASRRVMEKSGMYLTDRIEEQKYRGKIHRCLYFEKELG